MKLLKLNDEAKAKIKDWVMAKLDKEIENYDSNMNDTKFSFSFDPTVEAKEKLKIIFTPTAYLRMRMIVDSYATEAGWYGLIERLNEKTFRVYDVKLCKQYVDGAKVDTEDEDMLEFFDSLTDEEIEHLHFQAHSHVNMSTAASSIDLQNQADIVKNMGKTGFFVFQIWNKSGDISSYIYDLDNNYFYNKKDVEIEIEDEEYGTMSMFIDATGDYIFEKPKVWTGYNQAQWGKDTKSKGKKDKKDDLSDYYPYNYYYDY